MSRKAPVRRGLHPLERLRQNNHAQQMSVNVIYAYLLMPYVLPDDQAPDEDAAEEPHRRHALTPCVVLQ